MESQIIPENKQRKNIRCVVCSIIRWFFIVVLGLLLIVGLIAQVPWKMLIVVAIIWANLTLVPKMLRKWVWLGFAAVVAAVIIWIFMPEKDDGQWKPYSLDKEIAAFNAKYAILDEENAAVLYTAVMKNQGWEEIDRKFDKLGSKDTDCVEHWNPEDDVKLAELVSLLEPDLNAIREAAKNSKCRFDVHPTVLGLEKQMEHLQVFRKWTGILDVISNHDSQLQRQIDNGITLLQMGTHLSNQPTFIDFLSGLAISGVGRGQLKRSVMN